MKRFLATAISVMFAMGVLAGCGSSTSSTATTGETTTEGEETAAPENTGEVYQLRLGSHLQEGHAILENIYEAVDKIKELTNGQVEITVYPASQLGDYSLTYEELMRGTVDMAAISIASQFDPQLEMNFVPYMVTSYDQVEKAFGPDSYFFEKYSEVHANLGVKLIGIYAEGFIGLGMNTLPADYADPASDKGLLVRAPGIEVYKWAVEDNGYTSTTIPYSDLYSALQTGVCDGWIGGSPQLNWTGFRDVIKYYIPTNVFMENGGVFMSMETYNKLPEDLRTIVEDVFLEDVVLASYVEAEQEDMRCLEELRNYGVEIVELTPEELEAFREHAKEVTWPKLAEKIGADVLENLEKDLLSE